MAYVQVPKDLTKVKTKVMFNLTKRQLVCFGGGGALGVGFYFLTKNALGTTMAATIMILLVLPFFMFAVYEKDGRPLEKVLMNVIRAKFLVPGIRPYKTENMYAVIQREIYEQEVLGIGTETEGLLLLQFRNWIILFPDIRVIKSLIVMWYWFLMSATVPSLEICILQ